MIALGRGGGMPESGYLLRDFRRHARAGRVPSVILSIPAKVGDATA